VYKGRLHDGQEVVVKCLKSQERQGHELEGAFVAELEILYQLRHDHIVRLVGWCGEEDERMFVYEHTRNGTLRDHLHGGASDGGGKASPVTSSWKARVKALLGASRAIDHLHRVAAPRIIHRNVSSSSILLDEGWTPRVSDFGAAVQQALPTGEEHGQVVVGVVGAYGYIDPEYRRTKRVSSASDVYSFGVVMLEVLTGRPPKEGEDPMTSVGSAVHMIESGNLGSVLDRRPSQEPTPRQMEALELVAYTAARCLWQQDRPDMSNVVTNLDRALGLIDSGEPQR
jgi:serine/threonine protein kinase